MGTSSMPVSTMMFDKLVPAPSRPSSEEPATRYEVEQYRAFIANSAEGIWRFEIDTPVSVALSEDEQLDAFYRGGYLAECNDALARMYGFKCAEELVGVRLGEMVPRTEPKNEAYLRAFIRANYRLSEVESVEQDRQGQEKHFANSISGVVENGFLLRAWGTQRDITEERRLQQTLAQRERDYAALVDNAPDVLVRFDRNRRFVYINRVAERYAGIPASFMFGKTFAEINFPPEVMPVWETALDRVLQTGESHTVEFVYPKVTDNTYHDFEAVLTPEFAADSGERVISGVVVLIRDVTERVRAARTLRDSEERYRALVEATSQIVWTTAPDGKMNGPQPGWCAYTGQTETEAQGYGWSAAVHPDDKTATLMVCAKAFRTGAVFTMEHRLRRRDGEWRRFLVRAVPLFHDDGTIREWVGVHTDVTDQRDAEARQRRFVREMLFSVTEGRLRLCDTDADLPSLLPPIYEDIELTAPTLRVLRKATEDVCATLDLPALRAGDLITAVGEAAMNAVRHGGGGMGRVCANDETGVVQVWVWDHGTGIKEDSLHRATLESGYSSAGTLGHGFSLILACADRVWLLTGPTGTTVVLEKNHTGLAPAWNREP